MFPETLGFRRRLRSSKMSTIVIKSKRHRAPNKCGPVFNGKHEVYLSGKSFKGVVLEPTDSFSDAQAAFSNVIMNIRQMDQEERNNYGIDRFVSVVWTQGNYIKRNWVIV